MKKITVLLILSALFTTMLQFIVFGNETNELKIIKNHLENKTIENYETILIPLKGNPEDFNIKPEDDLETISFGDGIKEYSVSAEDVLKAKKNNETSITPYLKEKGKYHFPIIVSGREVSTVEIVKTDTGYKVLCVAGGSRFEQVKDKIDIINAKYIYVPSVINGFISKNESGEFYTDLSGQDSYNTENIVQFLLEKFETLPRTENKPQIPVLTILIISLIIISVTIICFHRKKDS